MPKALSKIQKKIKAKRQHKGGAGVHENSRDHHRLAAASLREERLSKMASSRAKAKKPELARLSFFQSAVSNRDTPLDVNEINELVLQCIHRDNDELIQMQEKRGKNPSSTKEDLLRLRVKTEEQEFSTGYYMPDLTDMENIRKLQRWDGKLESMGLIKYTRAVQIKS